MDNSEKRRHPRAPVNRPGRLRVGNGPESNTQVMDVSPFGATLFYSSAIEIGTAVELTFHLNVGRKAECQIYGNVRHHYLQGESHVIGVQFTHFGSDTPDTIREYILSREPKVAT